MVDKRFIITVKTVDNKILTFKINDWSEDDTFITFYDSNDMKKKFPKQNCQIEENIKYWESQHERKKVS